MTTLASEKTLRRSGRYAVVMGTLWRHRKREKCGRAAMGLLLDIWSWCADQGVDRVTARGMKVLLAGDKNGPRELRELVAAGFVEVVEGEYVPHDWREYNRVSDLPPANDTSIVMPNVTPIVMSNVSANVSQPHREITPEIPPPRARALSQVPGPRSSEDLREGSSEPAPPKKVRKVDTEKALLRKVVAEEGKARGKLALRLPSKYEPEVLQKAREHASSRDSTLEASLRLIVSQGIEQADARGKDAKWGIVDWQPGTGVVRTIRGVIPPAPPSPRSAFQGATNDDIDAFWARQAVGE